MWEFMLVYYETKRKILRCFIMFTGLGRVKVYSSSTLFVGLLNYLPSGHCLFGQA